MKRSHKILIGLALVAFLAITYRAPIVEGAINAVRQLKIDLTNGVVPVAAGNLTGMSGDITVASTGVTTIGSGTVETAMLESQLQPSHVVKYAGEVTWSGGGASLSTAIMGVYTSDILHTTINTAPTEAAYLKSANVFKNNSATFTLSAANTSNDAVIAYSALRTAP